MMTKDSKERACSTAPTFAFAALLLAGCYGGGDGIPPNWFDWYKADEPEQGDDPPDDACNLERDREAILGMTGTFEVSFYFEETDALAPGYQLREPYQTYALEAVIAVEEEPTRIVLQHVLLIDLGEQQYYPLKHWRQDWVFEDTHLLEYQGDRVWTHRSLSQDTARCTWSQAVSQVDDGPRYESYGHWVHEAAQSVWTSHDTWRPLPRREASRDDYDVLVAVNSHTVLEGGWVHGEDNLKWIIATESALVREAGKNDYVRISAPAATAAAQDYLAWTGDVWAQVRREWERQLGETGSVRVHESLDGVASYDVLLPLAEALADDPPAERQQAIRDAISQYVEPLDA